MKAIQVSEFGEPNVMKFKEVEEPNPAPYEVRVRLLAAGVNPNDAYVRTGTYSFYIPELPYTPGFDGAGVIDAIGEGVKHLKIGDRVFVAALLAKRNTGTYAQKVVCDSDAVHRLPDSISFQEGAALGIPALAAYRALFHRARLRSGETVLIQGASGGVGLLAVQMAKNSGATVIGTASTDEGQALVKASGADHVINHLANDSLDHLLAITNERGLDVIIECLANENLESDLKVIAPYGRIVIVGNRGSLEINPRMAMIKEADILGTALWNAPAHEYKESLHAIGAFLESGVLRPIIGEELGLEDAAKAHIEILNKKARGKTILSIKHES
ncbi:2-desacetyl-2-hydroxyethyl bacteriochlorophyllide A dehydrogenase [Mesobacillus persicus]|uniref:2-desacetyl-2-hydroxyethyl bacteriochlorophyllide A dehydrogenase n=1 Tax=Mesobacillus persicus TaxID=930146 RepID=A0A1H8JZ90_9BACI|nr:NADPH:quinone reductase [Mesobacillus persicus]SEN85845.1 2-desacetyl-2-hydroxyethyl bacteriochlorophyllide A dehydrogenase [Mesobacillus persicus]